MTLRDTFRMTCVQATALAQKKAEGKISLMEHAGLMIHLLYCTLCRLFIKQSELIEGQAAHLGNPDRLDKFRHAVTESAKEKMQRALNKEIENKDLKN